MREKDRVHAEAGGRHIVRHRRIEVARVEQIDVTLRAHDGGVGLPRVEKDHLKTRRLNAGAQNGNADQPGQPDRQKPADADRSPAHPRSGDHQRIVRGREPAGIVRRVNGSRRQRGKPVDDLHEHRKQQIRARCGELSKRHPDHRKRQCDQRDRVGVHRKRDRQQVDRHGDERLGAEELDDRRQRRQLRGQRRAQQLRKVLRCAQRKVARPARARLDPAKPVDAEQPLQRRGEQQDSRRRLKRERESAIQYEQRVDRQHAQQRRGQPRHRVGRAAEHRRDAETRKHDRRADERRGKADQKSISEDDGERNRHRRPARQDAVQQRRDRDRQHGDVHARDADQVGDARLAEALGQLRIHARPVAEHECAHQLRVVWKELADPLGNRAPRGDHPSAQSGIA